MAQKKMKGQTADATPILGSADHGDRIGIKQSIQTGFSLCFFHTFSVPLFFVAILSLAGPNFFQFTRKIFPRESKSYCISAVVLLFF
jgi:hypothetical protein